MTTLLYNLSIKFPVDNPGLLHLLGTFATAPSCWLASDDQLIKRRSVTGKPLPVVITVRSFDTTKPVSYTHLDVYKRQVYCTSKG